MIGHSGVRIGNGNGLAVAVGLIGKDNGGDLLFGAGNIGFPDAVADMANGDHPAVGRVFQHGHIVKSVIIHGIFGVDLHNDFIRQFNGLRHDPDGVGRNDAAVFQDTHRFDNGDIRFFVKPVHQVLRENTEMDIGKAQFTGVGGRPHLAVGLVRHTVIQNPVFRPDAVQFVTGGGAGIEAQLDFFPGLHPFGQCHGNGLGI